MGLVEGVLGKVHHFVVDVLRHPFGNALFKASGDPFFGIAVDEVMALLLHDGLLFLGHGPADQVAPSQGVARQVPHDLHDLLLVDDAAVGGSQDGLHFGAVIGDARPVGLALYILGNKVHGARSVEGYARYDILQALRPQLLHKGLHARGFDLEHSVRPARGNGGVDVRIVEGDVREGKGPSQGIGRDLFPDQGRLSGRIGPAGLHYGFVGHPDGVLKDRQGPKAQKIHF